MKIQCNYCGCNIDATQDKCPHCGGANEHAAEYLKQKDAEVRKDKDREFEAREKDKERQYVERRSDKRRKVFLISLPIVLFALLILRAGIASEKEKADRYIRAEQQQKEEEEAKRLAEELRAREKEEYDNVEIRVEGLNNIAQKDRYYAIEILDIVPYELHYDHHSKDWGAGVIGKPILYDNEHRLACQIKLTNYSDYMSISDICNDLGLYICDENNNSIYISDEKHLTGSFDDNYYGGGTMLSEGCLFINNHINELKKNQTITYWIPIIVTDDVETLEFHFDYNMTIVIDNFYTE